MQVRVVPVRPGRDVGGHVDAHRIVGVGLHHAQHVVSGDAFQLLVGVAAANQFGEQQRIRGDAVQPLGRRRDAIEIGADSDMRHARDLHDVIEVIGNILHRRARRGIRDFPRRELRFHDIRLTAVKRFQSRLFRVMRRIACARRFGNERRHERHHHDAIVLLQTQQHGVRNVARVIRDRACR